MLRKLLGAALAAAMVLSLSAGAFGADVYYTGGGGGGGGAAGTPSGTGGAGGNSAAGVGAGDRGSDGGAGGIIGTNNGDAGDAGVGNASAGRDRPTVTDDPWGDGGTGGVPLAGAGDSHLLVNLDNLTTGGGDTLYILGGDGGEGGEGTGAAGGNGGSGGHGNFAKVSLIGEDTVDFDIDITGGNGGDGGANTVGGSTPIPGKDGYDGSHGAGGRGGYVDVIAGDLTVDGVTVTVAGGDAGDAVVAGTTRNGGYGGNASFTATGTVTLLNGARIDVKNGVGATRVGERSPDPANTDNPVGGDVMVDITKLVAAGTGTGTFTTANGTADNGSGGAEGLRNISIGSVEALLGNMTLNFTDTDLLNGDTATFGDVAVGEGMTFGVVGTRGTNYDWTGNLTTFNNVTVNGLNASGKSITMNVDDTWNFLGGPIVSGNLVVGTSAADTASVTLNVNKDNVDAIKLQEEDPTVVITVFDGGISGEQFLEDQELNIISGGYRGSVLFASDGTTQAGTLVMSLGEDAYNALLAAPALMSLVNGGADAVERAAGSFSPMALIGGNVGTQFGVFASMGAASMDVDTGSGIESDSFHLLVGPGLRINSGTGRTDIGAFFEAGWGSFDTFNDDAGYRGEGDSEYYGGGLLLRHDTCFGLYAEASVRFGTADAEYVRRDINTDYDLDSSYVGGHLGLGYIFRPSEASSFDVFAKALATRVNDDSAVDDAGYTIDVDSTNSFRTQLGAKYSYNFCNTASFYVKGVWEHEFNGETAGRYDGDVIVGKPDSSGSSVIGELGVDWRLAERVSLGAGVYGVAGQREGFGGNLSIGIGF